MGEFCNDPKARRRSDSKSVKCFGVSDVYIFQVRGPSVPDSRRARNGSTAATPQRPASFVFAIAISSTIQLATGKLNTLTAKAQRAATVPESMPTSASRNFASDCREIVLDDGGESSCRGTGPDATDDHFALRTNRPGSVTALRQPNEVIVTAASKGR